MQLQLLVVGLHNNAAIYERNCVRELAAGAEFRRIGPLLDAQCLLIANDQFAWHLHADC